MQGIGQIRTIRVRASDGDSLMLCEKCGCVKGETVAFFTAPDGAHVSFRPARYCICSGVEAVIERFSSDPQVPRWSFSGVDRDRLMNGTWVNERPPLYMNKPGVQFTPGPIEDEQLRNAIGGYAGHEPITGPELIWPEDGQ
jgi:hypothetical protein